MACFVKNFDILFGDQADSEQLLRVMKSIDNVYQFPALKSVAIQQIFLLLSLLYCFESRV